MYGWFDVYEAPTSSYSCLELYPVQVSIPPLGASKHEVTAASVGTVEGVGVLVSQACNLFPFSAALAFLFCFKKDRGGIESSRGLGLFGFSLLVELALYRMRRMVAPIRSIGFSRQP